MKYRWVCSLLHPNFVDQSNDVEEQLVGSLHSARFDFIFLDLLYPLSVQHSLHLKFPCNF